MVDLIEIAKPLTRLKSIPQNQEPAGAFHFGWREETCIELLAELVVADLTFAHAKDWE